LAGSGAAGSTSARIVEALLDARDQPEWPNDAAKR
jgi:hypothetical protein